MKFGRIKANLFQQWTNSTRIEHPERDCLGYNTEENRIEFYIKILDKWFYLWQSSIEATNPILPALFSEDFESNWFINNNFNNIFIELFQDNWFYNNLFSNIFIENFEGVDW